MSKPSRRPNREEIKKERKEKKKAQKALRVRLEAEGLTPPSRGTVANHVSRYETVEEERQARVETVGDHIKVLQAKLPILLRRLSKISDPRNPRKIKHKLTMLMIYGILTFVLHMSSRREANRELTRPVFQENLKAFFPELGEAAHHDTLMRLLNRIEVEQMSVPALR